MSANLSQIFNSGSLYEQLIAQSLAIESQPRLKLRAEQTEQSVFKGVLSDYNSRVSALNATLERLGDPLQSSFSALTAAAGDGFEATASDGAASGRHEIQVTQLARADARLSKQYSSDATTLGEFFVDPGDPGDLFNPPTPDTIGSREFTINVTQDDGSSVALDVSYTPEENATNDEILSGIAAAINDAAAVADLEDGTGVSASVVHETDGTSRLTLRSAATGYGNRLTFTDTDGLLAELEVDNTAVRSGTGGGAVHAVGTGAEDSALSAAFTLDGLAIYRDSNTVDDALEGVTLTLSSVTDQTEALEVGPDTKAMRKDIDAFVKEYNALIAFINDKSSVDPDSGSRGVFAGDAGVRGLRGNLRADLAAGATGGAFERLADIGIETNRNGTLKVSDSGALEAALESNSADVANLFTADDGIATRFTTRFDGLLGDEGSIEARKDAVDARIASLDTQIERWDARLQRREDSLRAQFTRLQEFLAQAEGQQSSIQSLFFF